MIIGSKIWNGELPLQIVFWNWAVGGGIIVNVASSVAFLFLMIADHLVVALIAGYLFSVPFNVFVAVGVWRSAANYSGERRWADLARAVTIGGMILLSIT